MLFRSLGALGGIGGRRRGFATIVGAGIAGGFFLLPLLPLPPATWLSVLSRPFLAWPGHPWSGFPLWQSAILPFGLAFLLGPSRWLSPVALALCGGTGAYLLYGAATGDGDLWWMPFALDRAWLAVNGTLALVAGMGVAGMQKMRGKE